MTKTVVAIYDAKAGFHCDPLFYINDAVALRNFIAGAKTPGNPICDHAEDMTLFKLGTYDSITATFDLLPAPEAMINGLQAQVARPQSELTSPEFQAGISEIGNGIDKEAR